MAAKNENGKDLNDLPICNGCKNFVSGEKCKAFDFIPDMILTGENNHSKPLDGQENDIVFEEIKKKNGK